MTTQRLCGPLLLLTALAAWIGFGVQMLVSARLALSQGRPALAGILDALCFFTVLTNLLVLIVTTARLAGVRGGIIASRPTLAAAALYILVVGVIYSLLLRTTWAPTGAAKLADTMLHDVTPVLYVAWWLCCAPKGGLKWSHAALWLLYPLAYIVFLVALGAQSGRYLYPFADVTHLGFAPVLRNGLMMLALFAGLGLLLIGIGRRAPTSRAQPQN
jgi:hypothetical protein